MKNDLCQHNFSEQPGFSNRPLSRRAAVKVMGRSAACGVPLLDGMFTGREVRAQENSRSHSFRQRIGFDAGQNAIEQELAFAAENGFHYLDFNADRGPNDLRRWDAQRVSRFRETCETHDLHVGLHTRSAVNTAEFAPFVAAAVDEYLWANVDLAVRLGCEWIVVHAGFHFSSAKEARQVQAMDRLKRLVGYAEQKQAKLLLENLNREPNRAEVHYFGYDVEECRYFFDAISSPALGWAFTINHAHLVPEGIDGFLDAFGVDRIGEVRLADNRGDYEIHLLPGEGNIDFESMFRRIESAGYQGHYSMAFGTKADKLKARDKFAALLR